MIERTTAYVKNSSRAFHVPKLIAQMPSVKGRNVTWRIERQDVDVNELVPPDTVEYRLKEARKAFPPSLEHPEVVRYLVYGAHRDPLPRGSIVFLSFGDISGSGRLMSLADSYDTKDRSTPVWGNLKSRLQEVQIKRNGIWRGKRRDGVVEQDAPLGDRRDRSGKLKYDSHPSISTDAWEELKDEVFFGSTEANPCACEILFGPY